MRARSGSAEPSPSARRSADERAALRQRSDVIIAQEFMFTEYDWRVGVLNQ